VRTLLFTGKGGVGKTTVAAATALRCADLGLRTLVISTDPAHSLADAYEQPLADEPVALAPNLDGQQLDAQRRLEASWGEIKDYLVELFDWAGLDGVAAEELSVLPGLDELFALGDIADIARRGAWDVLVVDCGPTAETIRLLSLPDVLEWYMTRVFPIGRRLNRVVAPVLARVTSLPLAGDGVFGAADRLYRRLDGVKQVLTDPEHTSIRLVVNPERLVVAEARRTHTYLSLFGYRVDAVVANRVLPDEAGSPWLDRWHEVHTTQLRAIEEGFAPLPVLRAGWAPDEPVGLDRLRAVADDLYGGNDPSAVYHRGEPFAIVRDGDDFVLRLALPFAGKEDVDVGRQGQDILVTVGPYRRSIALPESLRRRVVAGARLEDGVLRIIFRTPPMERPPERAAPAGTAPPHRAPEPEPEQATPAQGPGPERPLAESVPGTRRGSGPTRARRAGGGGGRP
jgi:arsenite-transporting ATPase